MWAKCWGGDARLELGLALKEKEREEEKRTHTCMYMSKIY